jgi:hypothetical protein
MVFCVKVPCLDRNKSNEKNGKTVNVFFIIFTLVQKVFLFLQNNIAV